MGTITAVVKGDKHFVALAAAQRGIPAAFVRETGRETVVRIGAQFEPEIAAWLRETGGGDVLPGIGYPIGSLMLYSFDKAA
jgi:hypothetical protein